MPFDLVEFVLQVLVQFSGVLIVSMPITVLGSTFGKMTEMYEEDLARFNMEVRLRPRLSV